MSRVCTICTHPKAERINKELVSRKDTFRHIAARFKISPSAMYRHWSTCLPSVVLRGQEAKDRIFGDELFERMMSRYDETAEDRSGYRDRRFFKNGGINETAANLTLRSNRELTTFDSLFVKMRSDAEQSQKRTPTLRAFLQKFDELVDESFGNQQRLLLEDLKKEAMQYAQED